MRKPRGYTLICIRLNQEDVEFLRKYAKMRGYNFSALIRRAVHRFVEEKILREVVFGGNDVLWKEGYGKME